jgi:hypothetical protein
MHCKDCGKPIDDDSKFCRFCGKAQASPQLEKPHQVERVAAPLAAISEKDQSIKIAAWVGGGIFLFIIVAVLAGGSGSSPASNYATDNILSAVDLDANMAMEEDGPAVKSEPEPSWSYSTDEDKVRGATTYFARTTSTNSVYQEPPYDSDTTMTMTVRKSPAYGTDVILTISSGQFMCPSYEGCEGTVRFDDEPAEALSFNGPEDNSSDTIFVVGAERFIAKIKKARKVVIEKTLYEAGNPQFEFNVEGLKWER